MNRITVSITAFGIDYDHSLVASSISGPLREQLDEAESALECADEYPNASTGYLVAHPPTKLSPRQLVATQVELDFKRLTELVNEPSAKPVLVVRLPSGMWAWPGGIPHKYYILDGHHRVASAKLRGVDVEVVVVG
jgi:hypothetical protein